MRINGTDGRDSLVGTIDNDEIYGFDDDDRLNGGDGADHIDGGDEDPYLGDGGDTAAYGDSDAFVFVSLATGRGFGGDAERDTLVDIENLSGSRFGDLLVGDDQNNVLS